MKTRRWLLNSLVLAWTLMNNANNTSLALAFSVPPAGAHFSGRVRVKSARTNVKPRSALGMNVALAFVSKAMAVAPAAVPMAALPSAPVLLACSTIPTFLGYWKSEYGVSYAYALATLLAGALVFRAARTQVAGLHALCLCLYGLRLGLFLLYRETSIKRFREFREKIEDRATQRGSRLARTPFVLGCSVLYLGLAAPLMVTAEAAVISPVATFAIFFMYVGWGIAALGDLQKTIVKALEGPDVLVTRGLFALFRHPNYTGEMLLWTCNVLAAVATAAASGSLVASSGWLVLSLLGGLGINFVLMQATSGLEKKQKEKYGADTSAYYEQYQKWTKNSWSGPSLKNSP